MTPDYLQENEIKNLRRNSFLFSVFNLAFLFFGSTTVRLDGRRRAADLPARIGTDKVKRIYAAMRNFAVNKENISAVNERKIAENLSFHLIHVFLQFVFLDRKTFGKSFTCQKAGDGFSFLVFDERDEQSFGHINGFDRVRVVICHFGKHRIYHVFSRRFVSVFLSECQQSKR